MSKRIQYNDEPIGEVRLVLDFLPSPEELALKNEQTKVTIQLSSETVSYFKAAADKHHMQYQKMIRQLHRRIRRATEGRGAVNAAARRTGSGRCALVVPRREAGSL
jgi:CRP-like cAMP-binding protein